MQNWGSRTNKDSQTVPKKNIRRGLHTWRRPGLFFVKKTPIFIIILAFLFNIAIPYDYSAWAKKTTDTMPSPIGEDKSVGPGQVPLLSPEDIEIPPAFGTIKERFQQDKEPKGLIIHIQDLHTHYEAHKNIASIIEHLNKKHNVNVILSEASATDKGFAYLRPWAYKKAREKVAEEFLKNGILTAWEALDLSSDLNLTLQGVEDMELYAEDMDSFLKAEAFRSDALKFVDLLNSICKNVKLHMYSSKQKAFDEKMNLYREEKIGIAEYITYLADLSKVYNINYEDFHNLGILLKTLGLENRIDFKKAETEREEIIDILAKRLLDEEMKVLLDMSVKFKGNRISQHEFYQYLISLAKKMDVSMNRYPNFDLYTQYIASYHQLDASKLFEEINNLEDFLAEAIFPQDGQGRLFKISKNLIILEGLVDFKLTPDEFDYYASTKSDFDIHNWLEFLKLNAEHFQLAQVVPDDASIIEDNLTTLESFYRIAHQRDEAFLKNIEYQFDKRNIEVAMLMTGGFHTPGVTRRLKEAGYSYVVISPRIEEEMNYEKYHERLKESYRLYKETMALSPVQAKDVRELRARVIAALEKFKEPNVTSGLFIGTEEEEMRIFGSRAAKLAVVRPDALTTGMWTATLSPRAGKLNNKDLEELISIVSNIVAQKGEVTPEQWTRLTGLGNVVEIERPEGGRGRMHHDNLAYTPVIRDAIEKTAPKDKLIKLIAVGRLDEAGNLVQSPLALVPPILNRETGQPINTVNEGDQIEITETQRDTFNRVVRNMGLQPFLVPTAIIFVKGLESAGLGSHYALGRNQLYFDIELLNNPTKLAEDLNHDFLERAEVIAALSPALREELTRTATLPEARSEALRNEIARLAGVFHERIDRRQQELMEERPIWRYIKQKYGRAEGVTVYIYAREGIVEAVRVDGKQRTLLTVDQALEVKTDRMEYVVPPELTPTVYEIIPRPAGAEILIDTFKTSRMIALEEREGIIGEYEEKGVSSRLVLDTDLLGSAEDIRAKRDVFRMYLALIAEAMTVWRMDPRSRVYFDIVGTNLDFVKEVKEMYYGLPVVDLNIGTMRLWGELSDEERTKAGIVRSIAISQIESPMLFNDPAFYLQKRLLVKDTFNPIDWDRVILGTLRGALARDAEVVGLAPDALRSRIEADLGNPDTNIYKFREKIARLSRLDERGITAADIERLLFTIPTTSELRRAHITALTAPEHNLSIKEITTVDWKDFDNALKNIGEAQLSI